MTPVHFWYDFASTYSYPAAMRVEDAAKATGATVRWRPFLLGPIFAQQGWRTSPSNIQPEKGRYMWRDLQRICARQGLTLKRPDSFPQNGLLAARIALIAAREGWVAAFSQRVYLASFADGADISDPQTMARILAGLGRDAEETLERATTADNKAALKHQVAEAQQLGIFGAPSLTVGQELFWGNDRLEEAMRWAVNGAEPGL